MSDLRVSLPAPCSEKWEGMRSEGCNRHCAQCDTVIHDLSKLTVDEAEALLTSNEKVCVRAKLDNNGVVELKASKVRGRRMVAAIGASVGLMAMTGQAAAAEKRPSGIIAGTLEGACSGRITATGEDGRTYSAKIGWDGRYKVKHLPAGTYRLEVPTGYEDQIWQVGSVVVVDGSKTKLNAVDPNPCIIVGVMSLDRDPQG